MICKKQGCNNFVIKDEMTYCSPQCAPFGWMSKNYSRPVRSFHGEFYKQRCAVCNQAPGDGNNPITKSHIKTKKSGGSNHSRNIFPKCLRCHHEWGTIGVLTFCEKYPQFKDLLKKNGWIFESGKLFHPKENGSKK